MVGQQGRGPEGARAGRASLVLPSWEMEEEEEEPHSASGRGQVMSLAPPGIDT